MSKIFDKYPFLIEDLLNASWNPKYYFSRVHSSTVEYFQEEGLIGELRILPGPVIKIVEAFWDGDDEDPGFSQEPILKS